MTRNQRPAIDYVASYSVNRGHFSYDLPDLEHEHAEVDGLPLPAKTDPTTSFAVPRGKEQAR